MGIFTVLEIFSNYGQYLGIIGSIKVDWPPALEWVGHYLHYLRVDFTQSIKFPNLKLPSLDFRSQHIILTNALPLALAIILLIFFKSVRVVVWYCALLTSVGVLFTGHMLLKTNFFALSLSISFFYCFFRLCLVLTFLPAGPLSAQKNVAQILCIVGGSCMALCLLGFLLVRLFQSSKLRVYPKKHKSTNESLEEVSLKQASLSEQDVELGPSSKESLDPILIAQQQNRFSKKSFWIQTRNFTVGVLLLVFGLLITGVIPSDTLNSVFHYYYIIGSAFSSVSATIGWIMVAFGLALIYNWIIGHFTATRQFHTRLNYLFRKNFVKIILALLGLLYIPMCTSIFNSFISTPTTCPAGTEFVQSFVRLDLDSLVTTFTKSQYSGVACKSCFFKSTECPISSTLCPTESDLRLTSDPSISFTSDIFPFYIPGSSLALVSIVLGFPWLFFKLISTSSKFISELPVRRDLPKDMRWKSQCKVTSSSCRSLYTMFQYKWRHYKLITLIHKLIVVIVFAFGSSSSFAVICALVASHSIFAIMSIYSRPYINKGEDVLAIVCLLINVMNAVIALLVALGFNIPSYVSPIFITLNTVFPVSAIVLGLYFQYLEEKADRKREEEKLTRQLMQAEKAKRQSIQSNSRSKKKSPIKENESDSSDNDDENIHSDDSESKHSTQNDVLMQATKKAKRKLQLNKTELLLIDSMDQELDQRLLHILVNFFLFLGLMSFISFAVALLGVIVASGSKNIIYPRVFNTESSTMLSTTANEFAGYTSWQEFISHCCCQYTLPIDFQGQVVNGTSMSMITEIWKCELSDSIASSKKQFIYKLRLRKYNGYDGTVVRPYCSKTFNSNVVQGLPMYSESTDSVRISVSNNISPYIAQYLW